MRRIFFYASSEEYYDLYVDLMNDSPYLSLEVLQDIVSIQDFPDMMLRNILVANPHGPKDAYLMELLGQYHSDMPQTFVDDIISGTKTLGGLEILEGQLSTLLAMKDKATREVLLGVDELTTYQLSTCYIEEALSTTYNLDYMVMLADYFAGKDESEKVDSMFNVIDLNLADLPLSTQDKYNNHELFSSWRLSRLGPAYYDTLSTSEILMLNGYAGNPDYSGHNSQALLEYNSSLTGTYNDAKFLDYAYIPNENDIKSSRDNWRPQDSEEFWEIYPNPAVDYLSIVPPVTWKREEMLIRILNTEGRLLIETNPKQYPFVISLEDYPRGLYLIEIRNSGALNQTKKFIKY